MASLLLGIETCLYLSNRMQEYMKYLASLPATLARENFESCLVEFHALILGFLGTALRSFEKNSLGRGFEAFWRIEDVSNFDDKCYKMANRAEIEARNCDRDLNAVDRAAAHRHQDDLQKGLTQLENLRAMQDRLGNTTNKIDRKLDESRDDHLLRTIFNVGDAAYNSADTKRRHRTCLHETRVDVLGSIEQWALSGSLQYVYWLKGRAGTGKSTIALTIAEKLRQRGTMLGSFFFKRGGGDLARSRRMISTIAHQLAFQSPSLGRFICDALREDPNLGDSASLSDQYNKLLFHSLEKIRDQSAGKLTFVVVLDALDECDDADDVRLFLRLLSN